MNIAICVNKNMLSIEETKLFDWLKSIGISTMYIYKIKEIFNEEGIKFCRKTMNCFTTEDIKKYVEQMKINEEKQFLTDLLEDCPGVDVSTAVSELMNR